MFYNRMSIAEGLIMGLNKSQPSPINMGSKVNSYEDMGILGIK
jgi:hypothetical protein